MLVAFDKSWRERVRVPENCFSVRFLRRFFSFPCPSRDVAHKKIASCATGLIALEIGAV